MLGYEVEDGHVFLDEPEALHVALEHNHADHLPVAGERGADPVDGWRPDEFDLAGPGEVLEDLRRREEGPAGPEDVFGETAAEFLRRRRGFGLVDEIREGQGLRPVFV